MIAAGERVYVVERDTLFPRDAFPEGAPQGFFASNLPGAGLDLLDRIYGDGYFAERSRVEEDPSRKQIIPYALVVRGDEVFRFERIHGGERRLVGRASIGVGGHVNPEDAGDVVLDALDRELEEELDLPGDRRVTLLGLLNDDATAVGAVHLGVVALVRVGPGPVRVREGEAMTGGFVDRASLLGEDRSAFESWSAMILDAGLLDAAVAPARHPEPHPR